MLRLTHQDITKRAVGRTTQPSRCFHPVDGETGKRLQIVRILPLSSFVLTLADDGLQADVYLTTLYAQLPSSC
jgi:hypothetical protein